MFLSVSTPEITELNSAATYEILGTALTLTCTSASGHGTYAWNVNGAPMYVILLIFRITKRKPRKYNLNIYRDGANSQQYVVPAADNSAAGSYTCTVTISSISSEVSLDMRCQH